MPQTSSNQDNKAHALLIGVDCYRSFDGTGLSDLKGSCNDVFLLASYCVEVLGMCPRNITALLWPVVTKAESTKAESTKAESKEYTSLQGVRWGEAKQEAVRVELAALLDRRGHGALLFAFSGHGALSPCGEPVLCLGDTAQELTSGVLPLKTLRDDIKNAYAERRLIALLDCCHVPSGSPHPRFRATALRPPVGDVVGDVACQEDLFRVSDRVLLAARPGQPAYQVRLGIGWHGALTFALVTAADRWQGEDEVSHGSYKHVLKRAKRTLKSLGVPQKSELRMPAMERSAIRKQPFLGVKKGNTVKKPDAVGMSAQLQPDWKYTIFLGPDNNSPVLAQVVVVVPFIPETGVHMSWPDGEVLAGTTGGSPEYWFLNSSQLGNVRPDSKLFIERTSIAGRGRSSADPIVMDSSVSNSLAFLSPSKGDWRKPLPAPSGSSVFKCTSPGGPAGSVAYARLNVTSIVDPKGNTVLDLTHVQWYLTKITAAPTDFDPSGGYTPTTDSTDSLLGAASR